MSAHPHFCDCDACCNVTELATTVRAIPTTDRRPAIEFCARMGWLSFAEEAELLEGVP